MAGLHEELVVRSGRGGPLSLLLEDARDALLDAPALERTDADGQRAAVRRERRADVAARRGAAEVVLHLDALEVRVGELRVQRGDRRARLGRRGIVDERAQGLGGLLETAELLERGHGGVLHAAGPGVLAVTGGEVAGGLTLSDLAVAPREP